MHLRDLVAVALVCVMPAQLAGDVEILTDREQYQLLGLSDLLWRDDLSEQSLSDVLGALESPRGPILLEAISVVAVHRLSDASPAVERIASDGSWGACRAFAGAVSEGLMSEDNMETALRQSLAGSLVGDDLRDVESETKSLEYVRGMVTSVLVVTETRALRSGLKDVPDVDGLELSGYQEELLTRGVLDDSDAIDGAIEQLGRAAVLATAEYDLVALLRTYGATADRMILDELTDSERTSEMSGYGRTALLRFLQDRIPMMDESDVERVRGVIDAMKGDDFGPVARTLSVLEARIQPRE